MVGIIGCAFAVAFQTGAPGRGNPIPTGRNGYEEYVQATELLKGREASLFISWQPGQQPNPKNPDDPDDKGPSRETIALYARLNAMTPLEVRREAVKRYGRALDLIARGNGKPVFDPRAGMGDQTLELFPELAGFKSITKFAVQAATVYAADGRTDLATKILLDQMAFGDNIGSGVIISNLVGIASTAISVVGFQDLLPRLSLRDAQTIDRTVSSLLARTPSIRASLRAEAAMSESGLHQIVEFKGDAKGLVGTAEDEGKESAKTLALAKEFASLSTVGRQNLINQIKARMKARGDGMDRLFLRPEKEWVSSFEAFYGSENEEPATLADAFVSMMSPSFPSFVQAAIKNRTQLRLLKLYANAIEHRWNTGKWPERIDGTDPTNGLPYIYEIREDGTIRIASKGLKDTGEIDLKYKRPPEPDEVKP